MAASIAAVKRTRAGVKAKLTRFRQFVNAYAPEAGIQQELKVRLDRAEEFLSEFNKCQEKIRELDLEDALADEINAENDLFESLYFQAIATARQFTVSADQTSTQVAHVQPTSEVVHHNVKIPTIALPHFDGSCEKWNHFFYLFKALVDSDASLSNVQKFYYLQSVLRDQAAKVIHSLEITGENYAIALDLLKSRFENKRMTVRNHVRALFEFPSVIKESATSLRAMSDELCKNLRALKNLGEPVESWDTLIVEMVTNKLDPWTKRDWEQKLISENWSTIEHLKSFLSNRCQVLEALNQKREFNVRDSKTIARQKADHSTAHVSTQGTDNHYKCPVCQEGHRTYQCQKFCDLLVQARINEVKRLNLCLNCLGKGHTAKVCKAGTCKHCDKKHNSFLHLETRMEAAATKASGSQSNTSETLSKEDCVSCRSNESESVQAISTCSSAKPTQVMLSTAIVHLKDSVGNKIEARALLDSGSQSNFISQQLCDKLKLPKRKVNLSVGALPQSITQISFAASATVSSKFNVFSVKLSFSVLDEITDRIRLAPFDAQSVKIPNHVILADPCYNVPQKIDLLLGAGIFWDLICAEQLRGGASQPVLQKTKLGWIVGGPYTTERRFPTSHQFCGFSNATQLQEQLQRFWQIEDGQTSESLSQEESKCEKHFQDTHKRLSSGRFEVRLPCHDDPEQLGESYDNALKRLRSVERKLTKHSIMKDRYVDFMTEYEALEHMTKIEEDDSTLVKNYLPHHAITNEEKTTTKLRVVFDASCRTSSGRSLNDILMVGPVIQDDLVDIMTRFRQHAYVLTADITKMYRRILVNQEDRDLQRVLWRMDPCSVPSKYRLNTLTYGTGPASFLAVRCLAQLAIENSETFPKASQAIKQDFHMDDLITGGASVEELRKRRLEITQILKSAQLPLQKWNSNSHTVLDEKETDRTSIARAIGEETKILGLRWHPEYDELRFKIAQINQDERPTKRVILSFAAQLFDPLGLIGPVTIKVRLLLQQLWRLQLRWNEGLPVDLHTQWIRYKNNLTEINDVKITRQAVRRHVRSEHNPADLISRGIEPNQLINAMIWWHGPSWLKNDESSWPMSACPPVDEVPESKPPILTFPSVIISEEWFTNYSSLSRLNRIIAYVVRFTKNTKVAQRFPETGPLTVKDLEEAMTIIVKLAQKHSFDKELVALKSKKEVDRKSRLLELHPFAAEDGVLRVGERLRHAPLPFKRRFPIVLSAKHPLTTLIITQFHHRDLHAGPFALLAAIREEYWILSARNAIRAILRKCVTCFKRRPGSPMQLMGNLPPERLTPSRTLSCTGVDYAGPYTIKVSRNKTAKAYLRLFVCMSTKAVHLEIVSDMTTHAFLNSLTRFISRRGRPKTVFSDNGTNFVGAKNLMKNFVTLLANQSHQEAVINFAADKSIEWKFIPAQSPHVGGLWESAVKSAKTHAKTVIGETSLSFEELATVFCQIEACLNSRPLVPLSSDPSELEVLTPGHFLIGSALTTLPEPDIPNIASNRLNRYELITKMRQDFWHRWSREYVSQLQQRTKWRSKYSNEGIKIGAMVLIRDITPPLQWRLGKIVYVHPGRDVLVRTVTIQTQTGRIQRTLPKICVLPIE